MPITKPRLVLAPDAVEEPVPPSATAKSPEDVTVDKSIVGLVRVLFVSVCVPESVVTVESIAKVTALPLPLVSIPVPPVKVSVSLSKSILNAPPLSA